MPVSFDASILPKKRQQQIANGALNEDVFVQFLCNTGENGEHDPEDEPDDRVRPSHAAFHGQVFKMEDAPIPPLDFGCRCAIRLCANPESAAALVIKVTTEADTVTTVVATEDWLDENVDGWKSIARAVKNNLAKDALAAGMDVAKAKGIKDARAITEMVIDVVRGSRGA